MTPRRPALRARVGLSGRRRQPESSKPSRGGGWCDKLEGNEKFHNDRCKTLPTATPSPGCSAFDPADTAAWMPAEPRTVWFWGDSVMLQLWDHLMCFLSHHAEEVSPAGPGDGRYDATSEYGSPRRELLSARRRREAFIFRNTPAIPIAWGRRGVDGELIKSPLEWRAKDAKLPCTPYRPCVRFGTLTLCYGERWKDTAWVHRKHISCFLNSGPDDVHVLNFGVWHNVPDGIPRAVNSMMDYLRAQAQAQPLPHLVWMESLPQHFNSPGGLYYTRRGRVKPGCMRRVQPGRLSNFRNKKTLSLLRDPRRQGAAALHVFRTWDMLAPHPELHNHVNSGALDCTHWCAYHGGALTAIAHLLLSDISRAFWRGAQPGPRSQGGGLPREGHAKEAAEMPVGVRYSEGAPEREI
eukprot:jgi/Tetstr1/456714/TSEL_043414.t1